MLVSTLYGRSPGAPEQLPRARGVDRVRSLSLVLLAWAVGLFVLVPILACLSGCTTLSDAGRAELETAAAVAEGATKDWATMTPVQQQRAQWKLTRALLSIRADATGKAIPEAFATDPWATPATVRDGGGR